MILLNNNTLTVHYEGNIYSKEVDATEMAMVKVHALDSNYEEIINLCFPTSKTLLTKEGFWQEEGSLYYKNIKVSIPKVLANKFIEATGEEFDRLVKFWGWLSLNPNPETREDLYKWVEDHGIQLTNGGLMILYRRVYRVKTLDSELGKFVQETYEKLKRWKKSTNRVVWENKYESIYSLEGNYVHYSTVGNLRNLYNEFTQPGEVFTDAHTRTKRYVIGQEAREPRSAGDENSRVSCSKGLHMSHKNFAFNGFGDTPIAVVVNPCDILAVPDNGDKIRSCAFTPIAVLNKDAEWADDPEVHKRINACYDAAVERLENLLNEAEFEDFKKHEILKNEWNLAVGFETVLKILN